MYFVSSSSAAQNEWIILNNSFWPDIDLGNYFTELKKQGDINPSTLRQLALLAISGINAELSEWRQWQEIGGCNHLNDVPAPQLGGISEKIYYYYHAVEAWTCMLYEQRYGLVNAYQSQQGNMRHRPDERYMSIIRMALYRILVSK